MIVVFCLLVVLGLGRCQDNDLPSRSEIESSINRTIEEVERKIQEDPNLPRLTRQEIVKILYNVTSQELNAYEDKEKKEKARNLYQRALMVVLPYNAHDASGELNDLYTKPPMTQIIPDFVKANNDKVEFNQKRTNEGFNLKNKNNKTSKDALPSTFENLVSTRVSYKATPKDSTTMKSRYKNHRETYSEVHTKVPLKETLKLESAPVKFSFNLDNLQKNSYTTEGTTTRFPVYKDTSNESKKDNSQLEVVYSTSVTTEPTTKAASKEISIDLKPTALVSEVKTDQNVISSNQWLYNAPPTTTSQPSTSSDFNKYREKTSFLPTTIKIQPEDAIVLSPTKMSETSTKDSGLMTDIQSLNNERSVTMYVTPMSTENSSKSKYSSTYSLNAGGFRASTTSTPMRQEVMDLLASIGLSPDNKTNVEDVYMKNKDIAENQFQIPGTNNVIYTTASGLSSVGSDTASIANQNTFDSPGSQIKKGIENLTPEVQLLFERFGLQTSNLDHQITSTTQTPIVNLDSYTNFKPLPTSNVQNPVMKEFLAKFGLGVSDNRQQKAMKPTTNAPSLIEAVPRNMRKILENIGLITNSNKVAKTASKVDDMESTETSKFHVFKPHEVNVKDERQKVKINELLDTVRLVQEGKADIQSVRKVANDLLQTTKTLKDGPDPLSLEEIIRIYNEDVRNEVKRQEEQQETTTVSGQDQNASSSLAMTESTPAISTSLTDSSRAASDISGSTVATSELSDSLTSATVTSTAPSNLAALEESFGGTTRAPDPVVPTRRKSGLYFLVDWNTFLEVGEDKEKVNLRFQPKVGDRTRFLPVTVP